MGMLRNGRDVPSASKPVTLTLWPSDTTSASPRKIARVARVVMIALTPMTVTKKPLTRPIGQAGRAPRA